MRLMRWSLLIVGLAIGIACAERTPPPEPKRSPSPTLPTCLTDADCPGGEECRAGECVRPGTGKKEDEDCPQGCPPTALCMSGHCVEAIIDAGADAAPPPSLLPSDAGPGVYEY